MSQHVRTLQEAQQWFVDQGMAVSAWAQSHGFTTPLVYAVLHGRRKCLRRQSHRIAVALGLKAAPEVTPRPIPTHPAREDVQSIPEEPSMSP